MKKPWYIWLSLPAFMILWGDTVRRLMTSKNKDIIGKGLVFNMWLKALGNMFAIVICCLMLPMLLFAVLLNATASNGIVYVVVSYSALICLYFLGVYATYRHAFWRENNISQILH